MKKRVSIAFAVVLAVAVTTSLVQANSVGLVSYWPFDGDVNDAFNGNHGYNYGATFVPGVLGQALYFDGTTYVEVANDLSLEPMDTITVAAWVKRSGSPGGYKYIVSKYLPDKHGSYSSYGLYTGGGGLRFYVGHSSGWVGSPQASAGAVWDGEWHCVAGTFDGSEVKLYVDGTQVDGPTSTTQDIYYNGTGNLYIGSYYAGSWLSFSGTIDEVGIWNRALSTDEVAALSVGVGSVVWLPPIVLDDWTLNENATLPIKFQLYGVYGNLLCNDLMPTLQVNGETLDLRFDSTECYYISNFRPTSSGPHTAFISLDSVQLGSQGFEVVEPGKANGRGRGNN